MRHKTFALLLLMLVSAAARAESYAEWADKYPEAKKEFARVLENEKFREAFCSRIEEQPELMARLVKFLAEKGDRNTGDFADKEGKDARQIRVMHEKFGDQMKKFREFVREHSKAAVALFENKEALKGACGDLRGGRKRR